MPAHLFGQLEPHLESLTMEISTIIVLPGQAWEFVYFPERAIFSVINEMQNGGAVEVGTIGDEGVAGLPALMDAVTSESKVVVQSTGPALRVPTAVMATLYDEEREMRTLINRYAQAYLSQVAQGAACNRLHGIEQRCARWLLMTQDRTHADTFDLKQEFLADMLGVRRAGVSVAASALQDAGLIRYRRGVIRVLDREGLQAASCECYGIIRQQFDRLLPT